MRSALHVPQVGEAAAQGQHALMLTGSRSAHKQTDPPHFARLLRLSGERRGEEATGQGPEECPSVHKSPHLAAASRRDGAGRPAGTTLHQRGGEVEG